MDNFERDFKGVWIPKEIWLNKDLSPLEKFICAEIDSFDKGGSGCWASNEYLAEFLGVSEGHIANSVARLRKIKILIDVKFDGRKRFISLNPDFMKTLRQGSGKHESRVHEFMNEKSEEIPHNSPVEPHNDEAAKPINIVINTSIIGEAETSPTFDAFLKARGYYQDTASMPDANECYQTVWYSADGKQTKKSELDSLRREFNRAHGKTIVVEPKNELQRVFSLFSFNPAWKSWSSNRTQRRAAEDLLSLADLEALENAVKVSQKIKKKAFAPQISTPYDLLNKMDKLKNFIKR